MRTWGLMLCASMLLFPSVGILFQMLVSASLIATSEKVDNPLQFLSGKCMVEYYLRNTHFILY